MNKLFASFLVAAVVPLSANAAQTIPFARSHALDSLVVPVAGGCGVGRYRDRDGVCRRKFYVLRHGPRQYYSVCGGVSAHRVCNLVGQCWMVCD